MLAALIFATQEADDRPGKLAATLPFGGSTLIEYQARLLVGCGVSQVLVAVERVTPELLAAVNRIGRHATTDVVRSAAEASEKVHPIASVLVVADALVTTDAVLALIGGEGGNALLVTGDDDRVAGLERVDASTCWAGLARVDARRLAETAALPNDYDFQSALLRAAVQAGAERIRLPPGAARAGVGIERNSAALAERSKRVLASLAGSRASWIDRHVFAPLTRLALPMLVLHAIPDLIVIGGAAGLAVSGAGVLLLGRQGIGAALLFAALAVLAVGGTLSWLRGEDTLARLQQRAIAGVAAAGGVIAGQVESVARGGAGTALLAATVAVVLGGLAERAATDATRKRWWGSPAAYLLALVPFALAGHTIVGLLAAAGYAGVTLAAAIEALRRGG